MPKRFSRKPYLVSELSLLKIVFPYINFIFSSVETHALEQSLEFIKTAMSTSDRLSCADGSRSSAFQRQQPVAAVVNFLDHSNGIFIFPFQVGAASSQVSVIIYSN